MKQFRTYSFRLYPTGKQQQQLQLFWNHASFVYGAFRSFLETTPIAKKDVPPLLDTLYRRYPSLQATPPSLLEQAALQALDKKQLTFSGLCYASFHIEKTRLQLEGMGAVKIALSRSLQKSHRVTLLRRDDRWYADFLVSFVAQGKGAIHSVVGGDMGLKDFLTLSDGTRIPFPPFWSEFSTKVEEAQRQLSRKEKASNSWEKQRQKVQKLYRKLSRVRHDFLHQTSRWLVEHYDVICLEDLALSSLRENKRIRRSLHDMAWATFIRYVQYKAEEAGKRIILADRFFPSTKRCSRCAALKDMPLKERMYICQNCGLSCDRDENAANNLEWYAHQNLAGKRENHGYIR